MKKIMTNTLFATVCMFMLMGIIGIPVVMNHTHNPYDSAKSQQKESPVCEEAAVCCDLEEEQAQETLTNDFNCKCSLIASCCCCFLDIRLVSFTFDTPVNTPISSPTFLQAYVSDLVANAIMSHCSTLLSYISDLPPPKTYSQNLAFFQVFRI